MIISREACARVRPLAHVPDEPRRHVTPAPLVELRDHYDIHDTSADMASGAWVDPQRKEPE